MKKIIFLILILFLNGEILICKKVNNLVLSNAQLSNKNSNQTTQCIYNYLSNLSQKKSKKIISGQMTNSYWKLDLSFNQSIKSIFNKTNKWVGIIGSDYCRYWPKKFQDIQATNLQLIDYFNKGGLVTLMGPPNNPWTGGDQNDLTNCKKIEEIYTEGTLANSNFKVILDSVAVGLKQLQDSGVTVLWRPFHEMNGSWFWWGTSSEGKNGSNDYKNLWKFTHNYFSNIKKLNNLIWVFSPSCKSSDINYPGFREELYYYPGDEYVDIIGLDHYNNLMDIPNYDKIKAIGKPLAWTEYGPTNDSVYNKKNNYDYTKFITQIKAKYPDFIYWVSWNDYSMSAGKDTVFSSMANQLNVDKLLNDSLVINRNDINWSNDCNSVSLPEKVNLVSPINNSQIDSNKINLVWSKSNSNITNYRLLIAEDSIFSKIVVSDSTIKDTIYRYYTAKEGSKYYWRVQANNSSGWGNYSDIWQFILKIKQNDIYNISEKNNFEIIPNPVNNYLEIKGISKKTNIKLYDYKCNLILEKEAYSDIILNTNDLITGIYYIALDDLNQINYFNVLVIK